MELEEREQCEFQRFSAGGEVYHPAPRGEPTTPHFLERAFVCRLTIGAKQP
jgi:hypothetical protein